MSMKKIMVNSVNSILICEITTSELTEDRLTLRKDRNGFLSRDSELGKVRLARIDRREHLNVGESS
jgi:hypothetical protein